MGGLDIGRAPIASVAAEAGALSELLRRNAPAAMRAAAPVALDASDPPRIRALWEAVGWSDAFAKGGWRLARPEREPGRREAARLLAEMRADDPTTAPGEAALPARWRLVFVDHAGLGFAVTDESGDAGDPPVLGVREGAADLRPLHASYLNWCANELVRFAFAGWSWLSFKVGSGDGPYRAAEAPLPLLSPATRRLAPELWLVPLFAHVAQPGRECRLSHARFDAVVSWIGALPDGEAISARGGDQGALPASAGFDAVAARLEPGVRYLPGLEPGERYAAGRLAGRAVLVEERATRCTVHVAVPDMPAVRPLLSDT